MCIYMLQQLNKSVLKDKQNKPIQLVVVWLQVDNTIVDLSTFHISASCHGFVLTDNEKWVSLLCSCQISYNIKRRDLKIENRFKVSTQGSAGRQTLDPASAMTWISWWWLCPMLFVFGRCLNLDSAFDLLGRCSIEIAMGLNKRWVTVDSFSYQDYKSRLIQYYNLKDL